MVLITAPVSAEPWSSQDVVQRFGTQIHHWGQKGEVVPNKGWASYGSLRMEVNGARYEFGQSSDELQVTVRPVDSDRLIGRTLSIPRVGMFNAGEEPRDCRPDSLEEVGLGAEVVLLLLAQAFPEGPKVAPLAQRDVQVAPTEARFLQGVVRLPAVVHVTAILSRPGAADSIHFVIEVEGTRFAVGDWSGAQPAALVADTETLEGWRACWWGKRDASGALTDTERAAKLRAAKTFGEVRALKETARP
jgi:hypothetical protein